MSSLNSLTVLEASALLERGGCSSVELTQALLRAIGERDAAIHGYASVDGEAALAQARGADEARARGRRGRLLGVPLAVKDVLNVEGEPCRCCSRILEGYVAPYDATAIARLRREGAVFLGRTNMDEFAMGSTTENSAFGPTRNPWDTDRVPGGSSGGSAAVVAADEALAALGTDTGGSIRQPASFCGCTGLKPTYGRVSRYGLTAFASSLDQIGPLTKDVADAAVLLQAMAGADPRDSTSVDLPVPDYAAALKPDLKGMRLGLPREYVASGVERDVESAVRDAVETCRRLGAEVVEVSLPTAPYAIPTYYIIATAEASANLARFDGVRYGRRAEGAEDVLALYGRTRAQGFGQEVKRRIILGTYVLSSGYHDAYYLRAQQVRTLIRRDFDAALAGCDALVAPVSPAPACRIGEQTADPLRMYLGDIFTVPVNLAGICAMSVPCGLTGAGLPVGLQIIGAPFAEERILRVGYAFQQATDWHRRRPPAAGGGAR